MTLHPCQIAAPFQILNARDNIGFFFAPFTGTLKALSFALKPANTNDNGDAVFDVDVEGATLFPDPDDRPKILSGERIGSILGLESAVNAGDIIEFHAKVIPDGGLQGPVMIQAVIDDGINPGLTEAAVLALATGGDLGGTLGDAIVQGILGRSLGGIPAPPTGFYTDNFDDNILNPDILISQDGATALTESGQHLNVPPWNGGPSVGFYTPVLDFTSHFCQAKFTLPATGNQNEVYFGIGSGKSHSTAAEKFAFTRFSSGVRPWKNDSLSGDTFGSFTAWAMGTTLWLKLAHDATAGVIRFFTSPDGATWTEVGNFTITSGHPNLTAVRIFLDATMNGGFGTDPIIVDDFSTNVPLSDIIAASDLFSIHWANVENQFKLMRTFGALPIFPAGTIPTSGSYPSSGLPAGHTFAFVADDNPMTLWVYSIATGNWNKRLLNS
jgi:hypothetical protein